VVNKFGGAKRFVTKSYLILANNIIVAMRELLILTIVFVFITAAGYAQPEALASGVEPTYSHEGELIAYASTEDGFRDIYLTDRSGNKRRLVSDIYWDGQPAFTHDDSNIVFVSDRSGNRELWTVDTKGENLVQLTKAGGWKSSPSVSLTGLIAFTSGRHPNLDIHLFENGAVRRLTHFEDEIYSPVWSPDGSKIVFVMKDNLMLIDSDGSGLEKLDSDVYYRGLSWSDEGKILFLKRNLGYDLWSIDTQDNYKKDLIYEGVTDSWEVNPTVSSQGKIAFSTDKDGYYSIYVLESRLFDGEISPTSDEASAPSPGQIISNSETLSKETQISSETSIEPAEEYSEDDLERVFEDEINAPDDSARSERDSILPEQSIPEELPNPGEMVIPNDNELFNAPDLNLLEENELLNPEPSSQFFVESPSVSEQLNFVLLAVFALFVFLVERELSKKPKHTL
jgi:dipeptidyl aminopeptidase/acylaminoacyl peptidase